MSEELQDIFYELARKGWGEDVDKIIQEIERLNKELEDRNSINLACYMLRDDNRELYNQLEKLKDIIKEAREYIETKYDYLLGDDTFLDHDERIDRKQTKHILEILDKVGNE